MTKLKELKSHGQAVWFDYIRRAFLASGELTKLVDEGVMGVTSNPSIFEKAIAGSTDYDTSVKELVEGGLTEGEEIYELLALDDIRAAADILHPVFIETDGEDGYVSLEVSPMLSADTEGTVSEALRLFGELDKPNVMIKVPATPEGIPAITELIARGINVNVTLIFSMAQYEAAAKAYQAGLRQRLDEGFEINKVASVASLFVSRLDTAIDKELLALGKAELMGHTAVDNARLIYHRFKETFSGEDWDELRVAGAMVQRPLWASTGTKNPDYSKTLYVDTLIGPDTVNTVPPATLDAFMVSGTVAHTVEDDLDGAKARMSALADMDISVDAVTDKLLVDGLRAFEDAFDGMVNAVAQKAKSYLDG